MKILLKNNSGLADGQVCLESNFSEDSTSPFLEFEKGDFHIESSSLGTSSMFIGSKEKDILNY